MRDWFLKFWVWFVSPDVFLDLLKYIQDKFIWSFVVLFCIYDLHFFFFSGSVLNIWRCFSTKAYSSHKRNFLDFGSTIAVEKNLVLVEVWKSERIGQFGFFCSLIGNMEKFDYWKNWEYLAFRRFNFFIAHTLKFKLLAMH